MKLQSEIDYVLEKASAGESIKRSEALELMKVSPLSQDIYRLFGVANEMSRQQFDNKAEVFVQIGVNLAPCPQNCGFCSFSKEAGVFTETTEMGIEEIIGRAKAAEEIGSNALYLMTTANYQLERFLELGQEVYKSVSKNMPLVANIGDFGLREAHRLKDAGFKCVYHAIRLGEGRDTSIRPEVRLRTIRAIKEAGLQWGFCVEPVGAEHSPEEIIEAMFLGKENGAVFSGAMRRVNVPGTALASKGMISELELGKIVAITRLVMGDTVMGHCTHEPNVPSILAGANLLWAETGPNPRDSELETTDGRGMTVGDCRDMLCEQNYGILNGASKTC